MKRNVWIAGITAAAAVSLMAAKPISAHAEEAIPEGVYVGGMSLDGLTEEEAAGKVKEYAEAKMGQEITLVVNGSEITTSAGELGLSWANEAEIGEALKDSEAKGSMIRRYMKKKDMQVNPLRLEFDMDVDQEKVSAFVNEKCEGVVTEAKNATITKENGDFVITPSEAGTMIDMEATKEALKAALNSAETEEIHVEAAVIEKQPDVTTEELATIQDVLGTFSTDFSSSGASRSTNLAVGAGKINGHVLMPGEVLSGYECMHPFTVANGYRTATAYENGRSVDSIGGGVCQISTTLYNASLLAELEIVQRQNHSMSVGYVKPSMDAAIAGTYKDLKIKNPYDTPIYVEGYTAGRTLTFTIYGKETRPANRKISFESETLQRMDPGAADEQVDPTLAPGQRVKVQSGHTGIRSRLYKCVYVDGELKERTLLNNDTYNPSKAIYRVGPAAPASVPPEGAVPGEGGEQPTEPQQPVEQPQQPVEPQQPAETPAPEQPAGPGYEPGPGAPSTPVQQPTEPQQPQPEQPAQPAEQPVGPGYEPGPGA
ncbi:MAG: vanomycin resistance protein VanB [Lachnospiraceae bacterium]|jgi:vancomycin resistance protein YoaR|nr:vanomycin resistance protein VanB [Lachnospiraceae bacterium]